MYAFSDSGGKMKIFHSEISKTESILNIPCILNPINYGSIVKPKFCV
jgi:hypothetical protein